MIPTVAHAAHEALSVPNHVAPCADVILEFVEKSAGGPGAQLIMLMGDDANEFHCSACLGDQRWKAVARQTFHSKTNHHPLRRTALRMANLATGKKDDGLSRLLLNGRCKEPRTEEYGGSLC